MATDFNNSFGDNTPPPKLYQRPKFAREVPIPSLGGILHFASCSSRQSVGDPVRRPPGNGPRNQRSLLDYSRARRCIHPLAGGVAGEEPRGWRPRAGPCRRGTARRARACLPRFARNNRQTHFFQPSIGQRLASA